MKKNIKSNQIINDKKFVSVNRSVTKPKPLYTIPNYYNTFPKQTLPVSHTPVNNMVHVTYGNFIANPIKNY